MLIWKIVGAQVATLQEIETWYSIDDLYRADAFVNYRSAIETKLSEPTK